MFSSVLTKISNGEELTADECEYLENRFVYRVSVDRTHSAAIRLFHTNKEIDEYHVSIFDCLIYETHNAHDAYAGLKSKDKLTSAHTKVHEMKMDETGGLPYQIELLIDT